MANRANEIAERTRRMQRVQDEQGWIVIGWNTPLQVGDLFPRDGRPIFGLAYDDQPDLVVIGESDDEALWQQAERYYPAPPQRETWLEWDYYYKVRAE